MQGGLDRLDSTSCPGPLFGTRLQRVPSKDPGGEVGFGLPTLAGLELGAVTVWGRLREACSPLKTLGHTKRLPQRIQ